MEAEQPCDVPACINPNHLWLGTHAENMADMNRKGRNAMSSKTHCKRGHPFTPENTFKQPGGRACRICQRIISRKSYWKRRGASVDPLR